MLFHIYMRIIINVYTLFKQAGLNLKSDILESYALNYGLDYELRTLT